MLLQLVDLGCFELDTEPLDTDIERHSRSFGSILRIHATAIPESTWESSERVICQNWDLKPVYTYGTPFHEEHPDAGEVLLVYLLYADTSLSISQIRLYSKGRTGPSITRFEMWRSRSRAAFSSSGSSSNIHLGTNTSRRIEHGMVLHKSEN